jgi:hypothetical protein
LGLATLVQNTGCTKYTIDGHKACSVAYTVTGAQFILKYMDTDYQTEKQDVRLTVSGSAGSFDRYLPIVEKMLYSTKAL